MVLWLLQWYFVKISSTNNGVKAFIIIMFMPPQFLLDISSNIVNKDTRKNQRSGIMIEMQLQNYFDSNVQHSGDATLLCASFNEKWCTAPQRPLYTSIVAFLYCIQIRFWILYGQAATMYVSEYLLFAKQAGWVLNSKIFDPKPTYSKETTVFCKSTPSKFIKNWPWINWFKTWSYLKLFSQKTWS